MSLFRDWINEQSYDDKVIMARAVFYTPAQPFNAVNALLRAIRRCACVMNANYDVAKPIMVDDTKDTLFGSVVDLEALMDECYISNYRANIAAGNIPLSREDFNEKFYADLEGEWEKHTLQWQHDLGEQLQWLPVRDACVLLNAMRVICTGFTDKRVAKWMADTLQAISPRVEVFDTKQLKTKE